MRFDKRELLQVHDYDENAICMFYKVKEQWGSLSNMANQFGVMVNGVACRNTEALYQAMRFPNQPDMQREIIEQRSGFASKLISKKYRREHTRSDWDEVNVEMMRYVLSLKLAQNFDGFSQLLIETGNLQIVEKSAKDAFWGAKQVNDSSILQGANVLGKLLMELREALLNGCSESREALKYVPPLNIANFDLYGHRILAVGIAPDV